MTTTIHVGRLHGPPDATRTAARAVVLRDKRLLLLTSSVGDVKFPGGAVEPGET